MTLNLGSIGAVIAIIAALLALLIALHVLAFTAPYVGATILLVALARLC